MLFKKTFLNNVDCNLKYKILMNAGCEEYWVYPLHVGVPRCEASLLGMDGSKVSGP